VNREELATLRDAIDTVLAWPDAVRAEVARWLAPEAAKPNGRDPHPPLTVLPVAEISHVMAGTPRKTVSRMAEISHVARPTAGARPTRARRGKPPTSAKTAEQLLLAAMQEHSGASVNVLAKAAGANRSSTGERLRGLASRGVVTKDSAGHWRLVAELAGEEAGPTGPPSS
jgi:hypothetical protein